MRNTSAFLAAIILVLASPVVSRADLIVYGAHSDYAPAPGAELSDVRMTVGLSVVDGMATMTFTNTSLSEAVFKDIVVDTYDDDLGQYVLWDALVLTDTDDVDFGVKSSKGLPGYQIQTNDAVDLLELDARNPAPRKGLGMGETLQVRFSTSLADGSDTSDYLAFFDGGSDTGAYSIGFHAISAEVVNGESLSGMNHLPEPVTATFVVIGSVLTILRSRRRK